MGKHRERERGLSLGKMLKDIDVNQILSIMSALGANRGNGNGKSSDGNNDNNANNENFVKLLSNEKFVSAVNELSEKIKDKDLDPKKRQEIITDAFDKIRSFTEKE